MTKHLFCMGGFTGGPFHPKLFCDSLIFQGRAKANKKLNHPCLCSANPSRKVYVRTLLICTKYPSKEITVETHSLAFAMYFLKSKKKITHVQAPAKPAVMDPMKNSVRGNCLQCSCRTFTILLLSGCRELTDSTPG